MTNINGSFNPEQIIVDRLQSQTAELQQCLANNDVSGAFSVIEHINAAKEESIYYGLGMLARGLHTAIVTFQVDDHGKAYLKHDDHGAAPITNQLDNVIKMSEESARKTLNILDSSMPLVKELRENLNGATPDSDNLQAVLDVQRDGLARLEGNLMEILMAQGFQDLSGQAIRKVNNILETLQKDLISLLTYANQVKSMSEPIPVNSPVMNLDAESHNESEEEPKDAALEQSSVDDLLASLGF